MPNQGLESFTLTIQTSPEDRQLLLVEWECVRLCQYPEQVVVHGQADLRATADMSTSVAIVAAVFKRLRQDL